MQLRSSDNKIAPFFVCSFLRELPPVLNLQLNRFHFDMQYNRKKKLNSALYFPDVLDMAEYLEDKSKVPYGVSSPEPMFSVQTWMLKTEIKKF